MAKMGRPRRIESPQDLWQAFINYSTDVKSRPIIVKDWVGAKAVEVLREKERPLTMDGFYLYCANNDICADIYDYFANKNGAYTDLTDTCTRIKACIKEDQISGGMAGIYNPSITQRLNNLKEAQDITTDGKIEVVFVDGKTVL